MGQHYGNFDNKVVGIVRVAERVHSRGLSTNTQTYTFSRAPSLGEVVVLSSWWDGNYTINTPSGFTPIVSNEDGSEYPEGETCYKIASGSEGTTFTVTCATSDDCAGVGLILKANKIITTVSVGNTAYADGPSSLNSSIAADSPTTVASNTGRLKLYFLTGRQQPDYIQDPTPTFVNATGWIYENGNNPAGSTNDTTGIDNMDWAYKVLKHGSTDATEQITTNDTGRQGHHLISLTFGLERKMAIRHGPSDPLAAHITTNGLVFYINPHISSCWDGSSSTINDLSLGGLTCTGTAITRSPGGYFNFNGSSSLINTGSQLIDTGTYSLSSSTDDYTLEAWIYVRSSQGTTTNADSIIGSQGTYGVGMQVGINGSVPRINHGARSTSNFYSSDFSYNQWRHIVWAHDHGVGSTVYHNGASDTTASGSSYDIASSSANWGNMTIGNSSSRVTGYYDGWMGAVRVYNRALTGAEVLLNYNADKARYGL